jgi:hypothetical protein
VNEFLKDPLRRPVARHVAEEVRDTGDESMTRFPGTYCGTVAKDRWEIRTLQQ